MATLVGVSSCTVACAQGAVVPEGRNSTCMVAPAMAMGASENTTRSISVREAVTSITAVSEFTSVTTGAGIATAAVALGS